MTGTDPNGLTSERDQRLIDHAARREAAERFGEGTAVKVYTRMELVDQLRWMAGLAHAWGEAKHCEVCCQAAEMLAKDDAEYFKGRAEG